MLPTSVWINSPTCSLQEHKWPHSLGHLPPLRSPLSTTVNTTQHTHAHTQHKANTHTAHTIHTAHTHRHKHTHTQTHTAHTIHTAHTHTHTHTHTHRHSTHTQSTDTNIHTHAQHTHTQSLHPHWTQTLPPPPHIHTHTQAHLQKKHTCCVLCPWAASRLFSTAPSLTSTSWMVGTNCCSTSFTPVCIQLFLQTYAWQQRYLHMGW